MVKKSILSMLIITVLACGGYLVFSAINKDEPQEKPQKTTTIVAPQDEKEAESFDKTQFSLTDPTSKWVIVNKKNPLQPQTYLPSDLRLPNVAQRIPGLEQMKLRNEAATALEQMLAESVKAGFDVQISTAFRGYNYQKSLYDGYVASEGQAAADTQSARPGYSEHQTGWAVDIRPSDGSCYLEACFGDMESGKWLAEHAASYGFILRYPQGKDSITGYTYEPWHFRYVGVELALEMQKQNVDTMEEFFGIPGGQQY